MEGKAYNWMNWFEFPILRNLICLRMPLLVCISWVMKTPPSSKMKSKKIQSFGVH
jgi:hypothetical protein